MTGLHTMGTANQHPLLAAHNLNRQFGGLMAVPGQPRPRLPPAGTQVAGDRFRNNYQEKPQ